jgi:hypothetical protein
MNNQTWTLVDLPPGRKAIRCGWIYKAKKTNTELSTASKVAWWQKDIPKKPGIDNNDTFAPVGDKVILRFVLSFALHLRYELYQLDIDTAYLYGNLPQRKQGLHPQWSSPRLQESFWNIKMKNSILICTASSSEV